MTDDTPPNEADLRTLAESLVTARTGMSGHRLDYSDVDRMIALVLEVGPGPGTMLDVGCGTGIVADLATHIGVDAFGVDSDDGVMDVMEAPHRVAFASSLPFAQKAFDVVVASEVLEHLAEPTYAQSLSEITRVARNRIVITVPNNEQLEAASARCPKCKCVFSLHGHVRSFRRNDLAQLFPGFSLSVAKEIGPPKLRSRAVEWWLRRRLLGRWPTAPGVACPQCGHVEQEQARSRIVSSSRSVARRLFDFAPKWWLLATYSRNPDG